MNDDHWIIFASRAAAAMKLKSSVTRLGLCGKFLKPLATIILPKSTTFLGNFCKGVKIYVWTEPLRLNLSGPENGRVTYLSRFPQPIPKNSL